MLIFAGKYERIIDDKNRVQLPSQLRAVVESQQAGKLFYVTLGEHPDTLAIYTARGFAELSERLETEFMSDEASGRFELEFFASATPVEMDKQGRLVLPAGMRKRANLPGDVYLIGQKNRIEIWERKRLDAIVEPEDGAWPSWRRHMRRRPTVPPRRAESEATE